jgi:adenylylsulfate kinase-like enzyme
VNTTLAVCEARDPKGMYGMARAGNLLNFTGIGSPYEIPEKPDLCIDTGTLMIDECIERLLRLIERGDG